MHGGGESVFFAGRYGDGVAHFGELFVADGEGAGVCFGGGGVGVAGKRAWAHDGQSYARNGDMGCRGEAEESTAVEATGRRAGRDSVRRIDWAEGDAERTGGGGEEGIGGGVPAGQGQNQAGEGFAAGAAAAAGVSADQTDGG